MQPLRRSQQVWLAVFVTAWCFLGLTGRDAWKPDEATALTPLLDWLASGAWLPADSPFPLHTLLAGLTAWLAGTGLDLQDGARLASGVSTLAALAFTGLAARAFYGPGYGTAATLALMGAFGLMLRAHALLPETALMAGYALLLYGLGLARRHARGGLLLGLAAFALALTRGLPDLIAAGLIVSLPLASREWRGLAYRRALVWAALTLAVLLAVWLGLLAWQGCAGLWGAQFMARAWPIASPFWVFNNLAWFAWPIWPLALWTVWHEHRRLDRAVELHPVLAAAAVTLVISHWPSHSNGGALLASLPALALLAAHGVAHLKRGAAQAFYWFGALCFLFFALAFWVYFSATEWGWPEKLARHMADLAPGHAGGATPAAVLWLAGAATLAWLVAMPLFPRAKARPVLVWATGMALSWLLLITLFRPWAEAGWSYRAQIEAMARHLPAGACLRVDADPAMTTMLRLRLPQHYRAEGDCAWWLVGGPREEFAREAWPAETVWTGFRPRDKARYYALVRHEP
ncbi:MAG: hypothetical protein ACOZB0_11740 [Pseudomonadota bacterium]